jgi:type II secretory pathway pseudopilin PulG
MKASLRTLSNGGKLLLDKDADARGFSLVEVIVSAVLVSLSVVAVVSSVSTGVRLQVTDNDRRQARTLIQSVFEEQYDFRNYNSIVPNTTHTETVIIDNRDGIPLQGELTAVVQNTTLGADNGCTFPARQVTITCRWNVDPQTVDSIQLTKIIAQAQR